MNAVAQAERPTILIPGAAFGGGFFAGYVRSGEQNYAIIVAPKADGEHEDGPWNKSTKMVEGAQSFNDGRANTEAMAAAGSALAKWALGLNINGCNDWYLPSRDELEVCYRALKPTIDENWVHRHGENPSSLPPGFPYTAQNPLQTEAEAFQEGQPEAFDAVWYWSSTQLASTLAVPGVRASAVATRATVARATTAGLVRSADCPFNPLTISEASMKGTPGNVLTVALSDDQMVLFARATVQAMLDNIMRGGAPVPQPAAPSFEQCTAIPMIGQPWPGQGGIYAGMVRGDDGLPDYHLILAEHEPEDRMAWQAAMDYAGTVEADGHKDFTLPKRKEQAILFGNLKDRFQEAWYWSCETLASDADCAWGQNFVGGGQSHVRKGYYGRARAVRRLPI